MKKPKKVYINARIPKLLHEMIEDLMMLLGSDFTTALEWALEDWNKTRYLAEKERLLQLAKIKYVILEHEAKKDTQT